MVHKGAEWGAGGGGGKRRLLTSLVLDWNAYICFQETKLEEDIKDLVEQIWGGRWVSMLLRKLAVQEGEFSHCGIVEYRKCRLCKLELTLSRAMLKHKFKISYAMLHVCRLLIVTLKTE